MSELPPLATGLKTDSVLACNYLVISPETTVKAVMIRISGMRAHPSGHREEERQQQEVSSSCAIVVENQKVVGIVTQEDLIRLKLQNCHLDQVLVREVMTQPVITLAQSSLSNIFSGINLLQQHNICHLPILDEEARLVGLATNKSLSIYSNQVVESIFGFSSQEVKGKKWQKALHKDDRDRVSREWYHGLQTHHNRFHMEYRFQRRDNTLKWVYEQTLPEKDSKGEVNTERKQAETALESLVAGTATTTGEDFFPALASHIGNALNVSHVFIAELVDQQLQTLSFWERGKLQENFSYPWQKAPCERALKEGEYHCNCQVQQKFPEDIDLVEMGVNSYLGIALYNGDGEAIGNLCIFSEETINDPQRFLNILRVLAAGAAAELERQRSQASLEKLNQELEAKVEERTQALHQQEAELQDFFEQAHDLIQSVSLNTEKFEYVNRSWRETLGYSCEDLKALTFFDILHPNSQPKAREILREMKTGKLSQTKEIELTFLSKNGEEIIVEGGIHCRLAGEQPIAIRAIFRDITQRKKAERENYRLQKSLECLLHSNPAVIYSCQPFGNYNATFISENVKAILGYTPQEYTQDNFWRNHIHPEDIPKVCDGLSTLFEQETYQYEYRFLHGEGYYIWVRDEVRLVRDDEGNPIEIIGYFADITEQKQAEQQILESQAFLKSVITVFPFYLFWKDANGVYLGCNQNFAEVAGLAHPEEIIGKTDYDLPWANTEADDYTRDDQEVITHGCEKIGYVESQKQANGKQVWVETSKVPLYGFNGEVVGVVGTYQDITARKQAENQLQETNDALLRATQLKDQFLANMSHELRTPLNAILGLTEGLLEQVQGPLNEKQTKALKIVKRSGSHLLELINDILDLSKIESGKVELNCAETDVAGLCESALVFIKQQAYKKGIQVETNIAPHLPCLSVDERRIRQVLINLLNNAVKFTPEGGEVTLEVSDPESGQSYLRLAVIDTGIGIETEKIKELFQPFTQVDSDLNRKYQGTGLGLSLVKRIVELHGGTVGVSSKVGVGSCFTVDLPIATGVISPDKLGSESEGESKVSRKESSPLILLAEDNEANLMTIRNYLEAKGYRLVTATKGDEAVELAQSQCPDLILMDVQLPMMDGIEAIQEIRGISELAAVPIIALTALAMEGDRDRCLEAGANEYLSKPVKLKQLVTAIEELLP